MASRTICAAKETIPNQTSNLYISKPRVHLGNAIASLCAQSFNRTVWVDGATACNKQQEEQQNDLQYVELIILSYTIT